MPKIALASSGIAGQDAVVNVIQINPAPSPPTTEPERSKECPNFS